MRLQKGILFATAFVTLSCYAESSEGAVEIDVGAMIDSVISGTDFGDQELVISGIALNQTGNGTSILNLGTMATYKSGAYKNFVSVYDITSRVSEGLPVRVRVIVEMSSAAKLGEDYFVTIETVFRECLTC